MATMTQRKPRATKQERVIAAAERMTAVFGVRPLFESPRVTGEQVKRAVQGMLERTWATVPHVMPIAAQSMRVAFLGTRAFTRHEWETKSARPLRLKVRGIITLPAIAADATVPRSVADSYVAYSLHELMHWLYTNPVDFRAGVELLAQTYGTSIMFAHSVVNALEDYRGEARLISAGYAAGFGHVIRALLGSITAEAFDERVEDQLAAGDARQFPFALAYGLRGYVDGGDRLIAALPADLRAVYDYAAQTMAPIVADSGDVSILQGTANTVAVADAVLTMLKQIYKDTPQPKQRPAGDMPQPSDDDSAQDGEPGDSDAQPGDDGEPGDSDAAGDDSDAQPSDDAAGDAAGDDDSDAGTKDHSGYVPPSERDTAAESTADPGDAVQPEANPATDPRPSDAMAAEDVRETEPAPMLPPQRGLDATDAVSDPVITEPSKPGEYKVDRGAVFIRESLQQVEASPVLRTELRRLFTRTDAESFETGKRAGRLNVGALPRVATGAENVFARRTQIDGIDSAVSIVIDMSPSMNCGGYWYDETGRYHSGESPIIMAARVAAVLTAMFAQCVGVRSEVLGFSDAANAPTDDLITQGARDVYGDVRGGYGGGRDDDDAADDDAADETAHVMTAEELDADAFAHAFNVGRCRFTVYKTFGENVGIGLARIADACTRGSSTPDFEAIVSAGRRLLKVPAGRRVLIMVTDGQGADVEIMRRAIVALQRRGIVCIGLGIGMPCNDAYTYRVELKRAGELGGAAMRALLRVVERDALTDGAA